MQHVMNKVDELHCMYTHITIFFYYSQLKPSIVVCLWQCGKGTCDSFSNFGTYNKLTYQPLKYVDNNARYLNCLFKLNA